MFNKLAISAFSETITISSAVIFLLLLYQTQYHIFYSFTHPNSMTLGSVLRLSMYIKATCNFHFHWLLNLEVIIVICILIMPQFNQRLCNDLKTKDILWQDPVGSFARKAPLDFRRA